MLLRFGQRAGVDDEYLFGASLLVAPLFTGQAKRSVYQPAGDWYDFWTHAKHAGGRAIEVAKPADQIPVFVKGDTLLPLAARFDRHPARLGAIGHRDRHREDAVLVAGRNVRGDS